MVADLTQPQTSSYYLAAALASSFVSPWPGRESGGGQRHARATCPTNTTARMPAPPAVAAINIVAETVGSVVHEMSAGETVTPGTSASAADITSSVATCPFSRGRAATRPAAPTRVVGAPPDQPVAEVVSAATLAAGRTAPVRCRNLRFFFL